MFKREINNNALLDDIAYNFMHKQIDTHSVIGFTNMFRPDYSLTSTMRAMFWDKLDEGDVINLAYTECIDISSPPNIASSVFNYDNNKNRLLIANVNASLKDPDNIKNLLLVMDRLKETGNGNYTKVENITVFFAKTFNVHAFICSERKDVIIFCEKLDIRKYHYLQCALLALFPWYYNPKDGLDPLLMELVQTLRSSSSDAYNAVIEEIANRFDLQKRLITKALNGFELINERENLEKAKTYSQNCDREIEKLSDNIMRLIREKREHDLKVFALEKKINSNNCGNELMNYFLDNDSIELVEACNEGTANMSIKFIVKTYLSYFNEEPLLNMIDARSSAIYGRCSNTISSDQMAKLLKAIIVEEELKLRVCGCWYMSTTDDIHPIRGYDYGSRFDTYMPNTHLDEYTCIGTHRQAINSCLANHNNIAAIEQTIASTMSLNTLDMTVMCEFIYRLYHTGKKIIELPDGTIVTPTEAVKYLEEKDNE